MFYFLKAAESLGTRYLLVACMSYILISLSLVLDRFLKYQKWGKQSDNYGNMMPLAQAVNSGGIKS